MNLILLLIAIWGILAVVCLAVYESHLIKEKREIAFRKEEALRKIAREQEEKRQKRNAYMREYRNKKKEANK